jgi:hypothetical protein
MRGEGVQEMRGECFGGGCWKLLTCTTWSERLSHKVGRVSLSSHALSYFSSSSSRVKICRTAVALGQAHLQKSWWKRTKKNVAPVKSRAKTRQAKIRRRWTTISRSPPRPHFSREVAPRPAWCGTKPPPKNKKKHKRAKGKKLRAKRAKPKQGVGGQASPAAPSPLTFPGR